MIMGMCIRCSKRRPDCLTHWYWSFSHFAFFSFLFQSRSGLRKRQTHKKTQKTEKPKKFMRLFLAPHFFPLLFHTSPPLSLLFLAGFVFPSITSAFDFPHPTRVGGFSVPWLGEWSGFLSCSCLKQGINLLESRSGHIADSTGGRFTQSSGSHALVSCLPLRGG